MAQLESQSHSVKTETLTRVFELVEAFIAFDADNDGCITTPELAGILASLGYNASTAEVKAMMLQGDKNKDGLLSIEEFLAMNTSSKDMELGNLDGEDIVITAMEVYQALENVESFEDCKQNLASMDADGDGVVSFNDFRLILNRAGPGISRASRAG